MFEPSSPQNANNLFFSVGAQPAISGQVVVSFVAGGFAYLEIHGNVFGDSGTLLAPAGTAYTDAASLGGITQCNLALQNSGVFGAIVGTHTALNTCNNTNLLGDVTLGAYGSLDSSDVMGNVTWTVGPRGLGDENEAPNGFNHCRFGAAKTFTGPAGVNAALVLDSESNHSFFRNACVLAGGAAKVITGETNVMTQVNTATGTTGNQTINTPAGSVNFAAAATALTVTNALVSSTSKVFAVLQTNDATAVLKNVVPAAGSFVITLLVAPTVETRVGFVVFN
jgi:hypothetical protein